MFLLIGQVKGTSCLLQSLWRFEDGLWKMGIWSNEVKKSSPSQKKFISDLARIWR